MAALILSSILTSSLTNAKRGHRLGTSSATWNKIKLAATSDSKQDLAPEDVSSGGSDESPNTKTATESGQKPSARSTLVKLGPNGEICIWYPLQHTFELWDWIGEDTTGTFRFDPADLETKAASSLPPGYQGDSLHLRSKLVVAGRRVHDMMFMRCDDGNVLFLNIFSSLNSPVSLEVRRDHNVWQLPLPSYLEGDLRLKVSSQYVVVLTPAGYLYVYKYRPGHVCPLVTANKEGNLTNTFNHSSRPIAEKSGLRMDGTELLLRTATTDEKPIFDIMGSWLVYTPTKVESDYYKQLVSSSDQVASSLQSQKLRKSLYTSVKLPVPGPLLYRVVSSVSNSALDNLYKISEMGSKRVRGYLAKSDKIMDKDVSLHSISNSIGSALYSTANKIKKLAMSFGENEIIKVIDLTDGQVMAMFKPPGGVSCVSLSPYDLQLVHANYRGDSFYMWDLYRLPREVSLIGKFTRGKTSAIVQEIVWFVNNKNTEAVRGTNSGFGCITKGLGSIHWYNINYLSCGNKNNNNPNLLSGSRRDSTSEGQFLDSWILPSIKAQSFVKLPECSNMPSSLSSTQSRVVDSDFYKVNRLAFIDQKNNLRLVSPLNGKHTFKYVLPTKPAASFPQCSPEESWNPVLFFRHMGSGDSLDFDTPLSQAEIETCTPFLSLINNKNVEIATYDIEKEDPVSAFYDRIKEFGADIPVNVFEFRGSGLNTPLMSSDDDLLRKFNDGLELSPESYGS